ncbi:MAG: FecR domain-containing protein [Verrucomicrobia bacterium]|nr:FecR domain-containing protein [Verrucomicrobiota bacterium]
MLQLTLSRAARKSGRQSRAAGWSVGVLALALVCAPLSVRTQAAQTPGTNPPAESACELLTARGQVEVLVTGSAQWKSAKGEQPLRLGDRLRTGKQSQATVRLSDSSVLRVNELTTLEIQPPQQQGRKPLVDLKSGSVYFFSREKPEDVQFRTPVVVGAIRGTEFHVEVAESGDTQVALLDGEIQLGNEQGQVVLRSGEQASATKGQAPRKTAVIDALGVIQWCLYYPAVLDADELNLSADEQQAYGESLKAYRSGDLLQALSAFPQDRPPASDAGRVYLAALHLAVGQVRQAEALLSSPASGATGGQVARLAAALRTLIAAVKFQSASATSHQPSTLSATECLAESYAHQSRSQLDAALKAARAAVAKSPSFGFGWVRVAELEFSFGRVAEAEAALEKGLHLSPRNAQGLAVKGFLVSSRNRIGEALARFDRAIAADGALGNAWLGRGLCRIAQATKFPLVYPRAWEEGRKDLQVAATLEPNRALLRSYLGKAWAIAGRPALAEKDLRLAKQLDPNDPTAWLYSALLNQQRNRINEAVRDLEKSKELNDNRSLFRSQLLLDQDRAVRSANLASAYRDAGMSDVSVREAARAVNADYANYSAHLFLAESYDALRDPKRFNLRYETPQISELLVANLLAPVGAGNLSQHISQQDYARLFSGNHVGVSSANEYFSNGDWVHSGSQYGTFGTTSYALDSAYRSENGQRPNNDLERLNVSLQVKQQLTPQDSVYLQAAYYDGESGDIAQYYDQRRASTGLRVTERQEPNLFLGYHHEWAPGIHTLFLAGRLDDTLTVDDPGAVPLFLRQVKGAVTRVITPPLFALNYRSEFEAYTTELQQIWQMPAHTVIVGGRYQVGWNDTASTLSRPLTGTVTDQDIHTDLERLSVYGYYQWQILEPLRLTAGLSYDSLTFPRNIDTSPITGEQENKDHVSPKVGLVFTPWKDASLRALYTRSLGGLFFDQSIRLEPTQLAGFNQAFRSLIPESAVGIVPGTEFETAAVGFDQKFSTGTYLGVEAELLTSNGGRTVGVLTNSSFFPVPDSPSGTRQSLDFEEKSLLVTVNQLIDRDWSVGARYRISDADLQGRFVDVPLTATGVDQINQDVEATLQQVSLFVVFNHPCGFFSQFHSMWTAQSNRGYAGGLPGDDFWQQHVYVGYRFPKRQAEIRLGLLNLTDQDYKLNPLNLYAELPRERTLAVSFKLNF